MGGGQDPYPSKWLRDQLANNSLIVRDQTKEITAKLAIWYVCSPQLARMEEEEIQLAHGITGKPSSSSSSTATRSTCPTRPAGGTATPTW